MKYLSTLIHLLILSTIIYAQKPSVKIDINMEGRTETEVNEPGYTPWYIARVHSASIAVSGVTFTLTATAPTITTTLRSSWSKALVQSPYYMRLIGDGIKIDNDSIIANGGKGADMEMRISGLLVGKHTLQTFHNVWDDTSKINFCPINIYVNGNLTFSKVTRSIQAKNYTDATILLTELDVTQPGQEMVIKIESVKDFVAIAGKTTDLNVCLNAFELNTDDASKQAREPIPVDADMHVDADTGSIFLKWKASSNNYTQSHTLYFGLDSSIVANAIITDANICKGSLPLNTTEYKVTDMYNLNTYYWRVDETDSSGLTTKGKTWSFRPRHLAFLSAEGYGRYATGGRGGKVVEVTNLNDAGPGSFREAVTNSIGPRTIVFNVSGIIALESRLVVRDKYITIAGQTAPGKGICIRKAPLGIGVECICRFIRVRLGAGPTYDGMGMAGANYSIVDHCSVSWTIDEAFSSRNGKNLTLQRTLISEALNIAGHVNYPVNAAHGYAATISGDIGSFHHNLLAHCYGRNWSLGGGLDGNGYYAGRMDIFNNVVYNWGSRATDGGAHEVNFVNNYYKEGVATSKHVTLNAQLEGTGKGTQSYYYAGNILQNPNGSFACNGTDNTCGRTYSLSNGQILDWDLFVDQPFFPSYAKIETAKEAFKSVLSDVGCNLPLFDDHDKRIVKEALTGTYTFSGSLTKKGGIIDTQDDAGGYEDYPEISRPDGFDSDHDGLPDWWENLHGSNPNSPQGNFSDTNADPDKDGYTALEDYLEWMSVPHYYMTENVSDTINLHEFVNGYTNKPTHSTVSAQKLTVVYSDSLAIITPNINSTGINYYEFKVTDAEGDTSTRTIGICIGASDPTSVKNILDQKKTSRITVYPSLFNNIINIIAESDKNNTMIVSLIDLNGKVLVQNNYDLIAGNNNIQMNFPLTIPSQVYLLRFMDKQSGKVTAIKRIVKY